MNKKSIKAKTKPSGLLKRVINQYQNKESKVQISLSIRVPQGVEQSLTETARKHGVSVNKLIGDILNLEFGD